MNAQTNLRLPRKHRPALRYARRLAPSLLLLTALSVVFYLLINTSAPRWLQAKLTALGQHSAVTHTALAYQSPLLATKDTSGYTTLYATQSAALAALLSSEILPAQEVDIVEWQPPNVPILLPQDTAATAEPTTQPTVAGTPFVPDARTPLLREGTFVPTDPSAYDHAGSVFIKNNTSYSLNVQQLLDQPLTMKLQANKPQILLIHTHGSESYFPDEENWYIPTDVERTEDTNLNVVRIGDELAKILTANGFTVLHDRTIYDYPTYTGSYTRALDSITQTINDNPSIVMVIDLHRDSITNDAGNIYKTVTTINDEKVAQLMFVMGSDGSGSPHPNWRENLSLAVKIQGAMCDENPQIFRPMTFRNGRYNQHATVGSLLLEVGSSGNSLTEAIRAIELFGEALVPILKPLMVSE